MAYGLLCLSAWAAFLPTFLTAESDVIAKYQEANYKLAIPLLRAAIATDDKNPRLHAALLSALTYEGLVGEATTEAEQDALAFPQSSDVLAARGEFVYYLGDMARAEKLYRAALQVDEKCARAWFGLARLYGIESMRRSSRTYCLKAHELDPEDARITAAWLNWLPEEEREARLKPFFRSHPWLFPNFEEYEETKRQLEEAVQKRKAFALDGPAKEVQLHLVEIRSINARLVGFGLELKINGGHKLTLLFDTGAGGILLSPNAIKKAGLAHLGSFDLNGIGDKGARKGFASVADECEIGPLRFKTCVFRVVERKDVFDGDFDGLIGADVFLNYLIDVNFRKLSLKLQPLPERPAVAEDYDRDVGADEKGFTPVYRLGHLLLVSTTVNERATGLFMLDTGSHISNIDTEFARGASRIWGESRARVSGVSGEVARVSEVDSADLHFANYEQSNVGMVAFDMNPGKEHAEVRYSGILGLSVLTLFRMTLDYRNGLVKFEYVYGKR